MEDPGDHSDATILMLLSHSNQSYEDVSNSTTNNQAIRPESVVFLILQSIVCILACLGNVIVIIVILKYLRWRSTTNKFVINLAVADFFTGISSGFQVFFFVFPATQSDFVACLLGYQILTLMTLTSQLTVTFTTLDRYLAVCHPHKHPRIITHNAANLLIVISWVYSFVFFFLPFTGFNNWKRGVPCFYQLIVKPLQLFLMALTMLLFTVGTLIMYIFIVLTARRYMSQVRPSQRHHLTNVFDISRNAKISSNLKLLKDYRGIKVVAAVTLMFSICWLPYTYFQIRVFSDPVDYIHSWEWNIANWIVFVGIAKSIMNPLIYAWQRRDFNMAVRKLFRRLIHVIVHHRQRDPPASTVKETRF
ncbi:hypothetical protein CHS0354_032011 [Potamilus streckersoni]|uniref:G-protein coupled receptors family 1 profile domain-containing protein n=1 Tax=Potamilus streckersoni TaxID=2493646 RepID=A0AAE0TL02_9BIVA|nr:hypothetical protein CHS0354_032011 [Potamilus streckersoni]